MVVDASDDVPDAHAFALHPRAGGEPRPNPKADKREAFAIRSYLDLLKEHPRSRLENCQELRPKDYAFEARRRVRVEPSLLDPHDFAPVTAVQGRGDQPEPEPGCQAAPRHGCATALQNGASP